MKKFLLAFAGVAAAAVLAACSPAAVSSPVQPVNVAAGLPTSSSPVAPPTSPAPASGPASTPTTEAHQATTPPATSAPAPANAAGTPCAATVSACVDLSAKKAWLVQDGKVVYGPVPIMPGKKGSTTPIGMFHVLAKEKMHYSREFNNAPMPNSVFFYPGDAFHTGSLDNYSNGCVHLSSTASLKFFNTLQIGEPVQVVR